MNLTRFALPPAFLFIGTGLAQSASAQEDARNDAQDGMETRNCINLLQVENTDVVDEDTLLFQMNDGTIYRNELPHACPGLDFEERFMYRVTLHRLCAVDVITVIDDLGFGFMPGASCGLGQFEPITQETADEIRAAAEQPQEE